jgi:c-di-GMP-binding flagellar brake protein YcgR
METKLNKIDKLTEYLQFGMPLSVTIEYAPDDKYILQAHLIGIREQQFLILDLPNKNLEDLVTRRSSSVPVVIRGISDTDLGHIIAFKAEMITITARPVWLMFIKLPYDFETIAIRSNKRFKLDLPVKIKHNGDVYKGTLKDLSVSGCGISVKDSTKLEKESVIEIFPKLDNFPQQPPECKVVNLKKQNNGTLIGVEFDNEISLTEPLKFEIADLIIARGH